MTTANIILLVPMYLAVVGAIIGWIWESRKEHKQERYWREQWERLIPEESGVVYISEDEIKRIAWEVRRG